MTSQEAYQLSKVMGENGDSFRIWGFADSHFVPTYQQWRLHQAVSKAQEAKLFYTRDILSFVINEMSDMLTPDTVSANCPHRPVEGGYFGFDVYTMTKIVESQRRAQFNATWLHQLITEKGLAVGSKIKGPLVWGTKSFSSLEVIGMDIPEGNLNVVGSIRGSRNKFQFVIGAGAERLLALFQYSAAA